MIVAKKQALALGHFFAQTMKKYRSEQTTTHDTAKAIKATFGAKAHPFNANMIGRQTLAGDFFYMSTMVDTRTGSMFQSVNAGPPYYGPLVPPSAARIKGHFSEAQAQQLLDIVARGR